MYIAAVMSTADSKKIALVTGANKGIGKEIARGLAKDGFIVAQRPGMLHRLQLVSWDTAAEGGSIGGDQIGPVGRGWATGPVFGRP
jgi:NAD(P)-dependent dehydrogenase (short-subunit alcohol dehydrogenase family)